jgi:phosphate starvation-inducible membrane PsiE
MLLTCMYMYKHTHHVESAAFSASLYVMTLLLLAVCICVVRTITIICLEEEKYKQAKEKGLYTTAKKQGSHNMPIGRFLQQSQYMRFIQPVNAHLWSSYHVSARGDLYIHMTHSYMIW